MKVTRSRLRYLGQRVHWLRVGEQPPRALCGYKAGRTSQGWQESKRAVDCPRCLERQHEQIIEDVTA